MKPTYWQQVLHGGCYEVRREVIGVLAEIKGAKSAFRYACCGLADQLTKRGDEVFVTPKGCGHKLCPRCGRRRGGKYAKRIIQWLAYQDHGDLWMVCLTQRVVKGETLKQARARMAPKQRNYMRWLSRRGLIGAMTTVHMTWSQRSDGWHYHVHVVVEMPKGKVSKEELLERWVVEAGGEKVRTADEQCRLVVGAGPAITELQEDNGDSDFWSEVKSEVGRSVQYPMRDMAQGISATRLGGDAERMRECATEMVRDACGWKCYRAWGRWTTAVVIPEETEEEKKEEDEEKGAAPGAPMPLGPVHRLWRQARQGDQAMKEVFRRLEASVRNDSEFGKRLIQYCRQAIGGLHSG